MSRIPPELVIEEAVPPELVAEWNAQKGCFTVPLIGLLVCPVAIWPIAIPLLLGFSIVSVLAALLGVCFTIWGLTHLMKSVHSAVSDRASHMWPRIKLEVEEITAAYGDYVVTANVADCRIRNGDASKVKLFQPKSRGILTVFRGYKVLLVDFPPFFHAPLSGLRSYTTMAVGYTPSMRNKWEIALQSLLGEIPYTPKSPSLDDACVEVKFLG